MKPSRLFSFAFAILLFCSLTPLAMAKTINWENGLVLAGRYDPAVGCRCFLPTRWESLVAEGWSSKVMRPES